MLNRQLIKGNTAIIDTLISKHETSDEYIAMEVSDDYYYMQNPTIKGKKNMVSINGTRQVETEHGDVRMMEYTEVKEDETKANNKIAHGFHYELINQAKNFLAGRPVRLSWKHLEPDEKFDEFKEELDIIMNDHNDWGTFIQRMITDAQKYSKAYARVSVDKAGRLRFTPVSPKDLVAMKDEYGDIYLAIRKYTDIEWDEEGKEVEVVYAEVIDSGFKDTYRKDKEWVHVEEETLLAQNVSHNGKVTRTESLSWGKVPIIEWKFTDDGINSLHPIKDFIDLADANISDYANDLDDINELIWIVKNYNGQDLGEFMKNLKHDNAINVGADGDVRAERNELPYKARMELYNIIITNIYRFGQGIDFTDRENLGNITGTGLKWSYELLEEKANEIELHGQRALDDLFSFIFLFMQEEGTLTEDYGATNLEFIFDRNLMINESENITSAMQFSTFGSLETALENSAWVHDSDEELMRINGEGDSISLEDLLDDEENEEDTEEVSDTVIKDTEENL